MNLNHTLNKNRGAVDIRLIGVMAVGFILAIFVATLVGSGEFKEAYIYVLLLLGVGIMATMKRSYWLLIPFAMVGDFPAVPIGGMSMKLGEVWIFISILFVLIQMVSRRQLPVLYREGVLPIYLYGAWAFLIYLQDPVGLSSMGSSGGGLRFYIMIGLSVIAVVILMNQSINEEKAKRVLQLVLLGVVMGSAWSIAQYFFPAMAMFAGKSVGQGGGGFYEWQQQLAVVPHILVIYLVSRYSVKMMLLPKNWWTIFIFSICLVLGFASGKRSLTMLMLIYPVIAALLRKEFFAVFLAGAAGFLIVVVAVMGHGSAFELPKTAQRVLSVLPVGRWDGDVQASAENTFRETLNKYALREIHERPIIGEGLKIDFDLLWELRNNPGQALEEGDHYLGLTYSANSNWHNTWLGIAADFGIPAAVIWAIVWLGFIWGCIRVLRQLSPSDWRYTLIMFILIWTMGDVLRSWSFGHSAINIWQVAWRVGVWLAVKQSLQNDQINLQNQGARLESSL